MPWKECSVMDERLRFIGWLVDGEAMTDACREFGISRTRHCVWLVIEQRSRQRYASRLIAGEAAYGAEQRC